MSARREALSLLLAYEERGGFANLLLSDAALKRAGEEAPLLTALFYGAVERKLTLDYAMTALAERDASAIDAHTRALLRLGLYQLYFMNIPPHAAVSETVAMGKSAGERAFLNALLRRAARSPLPLPPEGRRARYLSVRESFPLSTVRRFLSLFGEADTEALLSHFNTVAPLSLTVNTARISRDGLLSRFAQAGVRAEKGRYAARTVRVTDAVPPERLPGFDEGLFFVQDEASALATEALSPCEGERILDVCAAPGGKILGAAVAAGGRGSFYASDLHESKLSLIERGAERLGLSVSVSAHDASVYEPSFAGAFDRVICDVPCSGLGVLGKKPDLRYREADGTLAPLGRSILQTSARYVREGGVLLYSTCTLLPEENEENVRWFLDTEPAFCAEDFVLGAEEHLYSTGGMLTLLPHRHGCDGFFMARLRRKPIN